MPKSTDQQFLSDVVTVTENGSVIHLCMAQSKPSKKMYPTLLHHLKTRIRHDYKYLVWSPTTKPKPTKYKWQKHGGYQGLNFDRNLTIDDLKQI